MTVWSAPGRPSSPPSGAEARVKRQKHLQTNGSGNTTANRDRRLTRGARLRYSDRRSGTDIDDRRNFRRRGAESKTASLQLASPNLTQMDTPLWREAGTRPSGRGPGPRHIRIRRGVAIAAGRGGPPRRAEQGSRRSDRDAPDEGRAGVGRRGVRRRVTPEAAMTLRLLRLERRDTRPTHASGAACASMRQRA